MTYGINVREALEYPFLLVQQHLQNHGYTLGMVVNRKFLEHIVPGGNLVRDSCIITADAFNKTFCQKREFAFALHIQNLIFDGRAAAIEDKNIHKILLCFLMTRIYE